MMFAIPVTAAEMDCREGFAYKNYNQVDADPIETSFIEGAAKLEGGEPIGGMCVALFTEDGGKRVALTKTDKNGRFSFKNVREGTYRLVTRIDHDFLCPANQLLVVKKNAGKRNLSLTMRGRALHECSDVADRRHFGIDPFLKVGPPTLPAKAGTPNAG